MCNERKNTQTKALTWGFGDAAYWDHHYALISSPHSEAAEEFLGADIGPLLSLHTIFSPLSTVGACWWGRGRMVLQSTKGTGVYWGVAATGGKACAHEPCGCQEEKKRKARAWTDDRSVETLALELFNLLMQRFSTVSPPSRLGAVTHRWVAESQVFSSYDRYLLNSPWMQFKEKPSLRWVFFPFSLTLFFPFFFAETGGKRRRNTPAFIDGWWSKSNSYSAAKWASITEQLHCW